MRRGLWGLFFLLMVTFQIVIAVPLMAGDYNVSDIALSPGADASKLNFAWHTDSADGTCDVKISKKLLGIFPSIATKFTSGAAPVAADNDEDGNADYYCKVSATGFEESTEYVYRVGDGSNWSDSYYYTTKDQNEYGFFFVGDAQIGSSGPKSYSTSDGKSYIAEYYLTQNYATVIADATLTGKVQTYLTATETSSLAEEYLTSFYAGYPEKASADLALYTTGTLATSNATLDTAVDTYVADGIAALLADFTSGTQAEKTATMVSMYTSIASGSSTKYLPTTYHNAIKALYNAYKTDSAYTGSYWTIANLPSILALEATYNVAGITQGLLDQIMAKTDDQIAYSDNTDGWVTTMGIANKEFPDAAFLLSGGDQVHSNTKEWEWTGYLSPSELTSLPLAPTFGSHDAGVNMANHFNLPNLSTYAASAMGSDYYFTHGNVLFMVLNMDTTMGLYPRGAAPSGSPPNGGGGGGGDGTVDTTDTDGDGVYDTSDTCANTPADDWVDSSGCSLATDGDVDLDGVLNGTRTSGDQCNNTYAAHLTAGYISNTTGCPFNDKDNDGVPDEVDRCGNTTDDKTVDENGCADTSYIETDEEFAAKIYNLEHGCTTDSTTGVETCTGVDGLAAFKTSAAEHDTFIKTVTAANPDVKWKVVLWHYSAYSVGNHSSDDSVRYLSNTMAPVIDASDIDVVFMGHDHAYTRTYQMLGNEPQNTQTVYTTDANKFVNPTGTLFITGSSSSGGQYYQLNGNIDATSSSNWFYDYKNVGLQPNLPSFSYITVTDDTLKISTYSYTLGEMIGTYTKALMDEVTLTTIEEPVVTPEEETTTMKDPDDGGLCFIKTAGLHTPLTHEVAAGFLILLVLIAGGCVVYRRKTKGNI